MVHDKSQRVKNKNLKILILTKWFPTKNNPIAGIFVKELAESVALYDEVLVLHAFQDAPKKGLYDVLENVENGIKVIQIKYKKLFCNVLSDLVYVYSLMRVLQKMRKEFKPDIVHVHVYFMGVFAIFLKKLYGIPFVVTEHYKIVENSNSFSGKTVNKIKLYLASLVLKSASLLILPSRAMARDIERHGINVENFKIVPNVVNTMIFYPKNEKKNDKIKKILFVGGLNSVKGLPYLLYALQIIKKKRRDFILEIIGDGDKRVEYEKLVSKLGLEEVVIFRGLRPKTEVAEFMRQCDFFVLPSLWESQSCVLIEAMACGKPVVATSCGGPGEIVREYCGILVSPKNVVALAEAIEYMLDNFQNYSPHKIVQYVKNTFSREKISRKLREIYISVLEQKIKEA